MRRSPLLPIFLIVMVDVLGLTLLIPLLPFYAEHLGASPLQVGLLLSTFSVCQLVASPLMGRLSDRVGRKPLLLISQVGTLAGLLLLSWAEVLWLVFLSRAITGLTAGKLTIAQAYIADVTRPEDRARSFGVIGIAFGIGFLIGPAVSGYLSQYGYRYPVLMAAGLSLTSILATALLLPARSPAPPEEAEAAMVDEGPAAPGGHRLPLLDWRAYAGYFRRPQLASLLFQFLFFTLAFSTFMSGFALFAERRLTLDGRPFGPKEVGYFLGYSGLLAIILQGGVFGRLVKRFGELSVVMAGFVGATAGYVFLGASYAIPTLLVAATFSAFGNGVLRPTLTSLVSQQVGRGEQGLVLGLTQSLTSAAQIVAPVVAGLLIGHGWLTTWAALAAVLTGLGFALSRIGPAPEPAPRASAG